MIWSASNTVVSGVTVVILLPLRSRTSATFLFIRHCFGEQSFKVNYAKSDGKPRPDGHFMEKPWFSRKRPPFDPSQKKCIIAEILIVPFNHEILNIQGINSNRFIHSIL